MVRLADWWPTYHFGWLAGREVVCSVGLLVVELSLGRCCGFLGGRAVRLSRVCQFSGLQVGGRAVSLDGEAGCEAVSLDGWLVVEDGQACREAVSLRGRSG